MKQQKGFAHTILIVGLLVALAGALGFIFWQNFIFPTSSDTNNEFKTINYSPDDFSGEVRTAKVYRKIKTREECNKVKGESVLAGIGIFVGCKPK